VRRGAIAAWVIFIGVVSVRSESLRIEHSGFDSNCAD
jgi:hypothetical protein